MTEMLTVSPLIEATGYALLAFLWQGGAIGIVAMLLATLSRRATPNTRYFLGCAMLAALMLTPLVTLAGHLDGTSGPARQGVSTRLNAVATDASLSRVEASRAVHEDARPLADSRFSIVVTAWAIGVVVFGLHLFRGGVLVRRLRRAASPLVAADQLETLGRLAGRLGLAQPVQLFESWSIDVPAVIGWLRPAIVVPVSALAGLSASHFEAILAHELAHVRRRDYLVNLMQRVVETLLFYHPAVWWVSGWIRREREHGCDDIAAAACGDRVGYARALHALEELRADAPALAMGARGGQLLVRMRRLVHRTPVPAPGWPGGVAMIVPLVVFLTVAIFAGGPGLAATQPVGEVTGTVTDPSGGMLPGATVVLRSRATSEAESTVTSATGNFTVDDVIAGDYELDVSLSGFRRDQRTVQVAVGQRLTAKIQMQLGSVAEEIMVTARPGEFTSPSGQMPASLQTAADYLAAARFYYDREAFSDADAMTARAVELTHASQPQLTPIPDRPGIVRVGGSIKEPRKTYHVPPIYPAAALAAGSEGTVIMQAIIARDGTVADARITSAASPFDDAAIGAVRQWMFTPTLLNGIPVEVLMTVTVNFKMR
jgi:TonB family protein